MMTPRLFVQLLLRLAAVLSAVAAFTPTDGAFRRVRTICQAGIDTSFMWNAGLNFGKGPFVYYSNFERMMSVFPPEDRQAFPELFQIPPGVHEVRLSSPLGIVFEEIESGKGLYVQDLVEDGNAAREGTVQIGDILLGITAVKVVGAKYERRLIPARKFDFDTMVGAVQSNSPKWGCDDVMIMVERPGEADSAKVQEFMKFYEPPFDNPWKQRQ
jgi:hypothetical protein